ncbi:hypothetical protein DL95DRAFT_399230 [Leptodontidium sp. 2 PMI_412]|nr:hypothetical protein DL95DRAFT_399230 [Leptodontidium sp. 2 PMI_412]
MGFDSDFELYPASEAHEGRPGAEAEHGDGGGVVRVNTDSGKSCITSRMEYPHLPRRCEQGQRQFTRSTVHPRSEADT